MSFFVPVSVPSGKCHAVTSGVLLGGGFLLNSAVDKLLIAQDDLSFHTVDKFDIVQICCIMKYSTG